MCVYVGYILKTKPFLNLRFKFDWESENKTFNINYNYFQNVSFFNFEVHYLFEIK